MKELLKAWKAQNGQGVVELNSDTAIKECIGYILNSVVNAKIGIVLCDNTKDYSYLNDFKDNIVNIRDVFNLDNVESYFIIIAVDIEHLRFSTKTALTKIKTKYRFYITSHYNSIDTIIKKEMKLVKPITPTYNEYNYKIDMSLDILDDYSKLEEKMTNLLAMFGNYDNITGCIAGGTGKSAYDFRNEFATSMGWHNELNLDIPMFAQINKCYHPDNLFESATLYNSLVRLRSNIISKSNDKVKEAVAIAMANKYKQIVICVRGDEVADDINFKLKVNGIKSEAVHANTKRAYIIDEDTDEPITYKTGKNKGEAKLFGVKSLNEYYLSLFAKGKLKVIVTTGTIDKKSTIANCDLFIRISPKAPNYFELKSRINTFAFNTVINVINVVYDIPKDLGVVKDKQYKLGTTVKEVEQLSQMVI